MPVKRNNDNPLGTDKIEAFSEIMDTCLTSSNTRFNLEALDILEDLMLLDARSFRAIQKDTHSDGVFTKLTDSLEKIQPETIFNWTYFLCRSGS